MGGARVNRPGASWAHVAFSGILAGYETNVIGPIAALDRSGVDTARGEELMVQGPMLALPF